MGQKLVFLLGLIALSSGVTRAVDMVDLRIAAGIDDVEEYVSDHHMYVDSSDMEFPYEDSGNPPSAEQVIGLRWVAPVPAGVQILKAYIGIECDETKGGTNRVNLIIEGQLAPNAPAFTTGTANVTSRTRTKAQVKWAVPTWTQTDVKLQSADLSPIIEEIVGQPGWSPGNALVLIVRDDKSNPSTGIRCGEAYEGEPTAATLLHIEWSLGGAGTPSPAEGQTDVARDTVLNWSAGNSAAPTNGHTVFFSTNLDDVKNGVGGITQSATSFDPGRLQYGTTYYWRVRETNVAPKAGVSEGSIWSFTTELFAYPIQGQSIIATASSVGLPASGPQNTVNGSGLDAGGLHGTDPAAMWLSGLEASGAWIQYEFDQVYKLHEMWVWNSNQVTETLLGFGLKDVTVEYSRDGAAWTVLASAPQFARAPGVSGYAHNTTVGFGGVPVRYVRLRPSSNWGGVLPQYSLSEVRFFYIPVQAREPQPKTAQTEVIPETTLTWQSGREAVSHNVYLGTDPNALILAATTTQSSFVPASLDLGTTYYWRIDEVNAMETSSLWTGKVWSFSTRVYSLVDDMESYTDETGKAIFDAWLDGYTVAENGSQVGYTQSPFAERTIIHGGRQSMPLRYDNISPVNYSEAELTWTAPQDWTRNGADTLSLWFRGILPGFLQVAPDHVVMNGMGTDLVGTADQGRFVYKQLTGNGAIVARVDRLVATDGQAKACVMIRQTLQANSMMAYSTLTAGYGCYFVVRPAAGAAATSDLAVATAAQTAVRAPVWLKLERVGNQFNAYYATTAAPTTWIASPLKPQTVAMTDPVYIGLAVTSHVATGVAEAELSAIATTGNVTGNWQSVDLGLAQSPGNTLDTFYVTVKDTVGKSVTLKHPDALAVASDQWQQWQIPLSALTGVNAAKIKTLILGVGDRTAPQHGVGTLYIDDIAVGRPMQ